MEEEEEKRWAFWVPTLHVVEIYVNIRDILKDMFSEHLLK